MAKRHWLTEIGEAVRERAKDAIDDVAAGLRDTVSYGYPPAPPPQMHIQGYLAAEPEMRQAFLQGLPPEEFGSTMSRLQSEAVDRFGAMAQAIMPMLSMEEAQGHIAYAQQATPEAGVTAAMAELNEILGLGDGAFGP